MKLNIDQANAIKKIVPVLTGRSLERQVLLFGKAGTGKTFVTQYICNLLIEKKYSVVAAAFTHKAVAVLASNLNPSVKTSTVDALLGWRFDDEEEHRNSGWTGEDVLIVDEASMIDHKRYAALLKWADVHDVCILWVGDHFQLPPVGGTVCSPVFHKDAYRYRLTEIVRQKEGSGIIQLGGYILDCLKKKTPPTVDAISGLRKPGEVDVIQGVQAALDIVESERKQGRSAVALGYTNALVAAMGKTLAERLTGAQFAVGAPLVFATSYPASDSQGIKNGEQATIAGVDRPLPQVRPLDLECAQLSLKTSAGRVRVLAPTDTCAYLAAVKKLKSVAQGLGLASMDKEKSPEDRYRAWQAMKEVKDDIERARKAYADVRHPYSSTVHKSQGSTFDVSVICWDDIIGKARSNLDGCRLLYVAVTRASERAVVVYN